MQEEQQEGQSEPRIQADEDWKKSVAEEKARLREQEESAAAEEGKPERGPVPEADVRVFLAGLYTQTLICLGSIEHPVTGNLETDLPEAQYLVDTIAMLKDKTKGNLTSEEDSYLEGILYDLRMRYVSAAARERATGESEEAVQEP